LTSHLPSATLFRATVAVNCCVPPAPTVADVGEIATLTGIVDTLPQPTISNTLIATPPSHTQDASSRIGFRLPPQPAVFIASQDLTCLAVGYTIEAVSSCACSTTSLLLLRSPRGGLAWLRRRSYATSSMISGGT